MSLRNLDGTLFSVFPFSSSPFLFSQLPLTLNLFLLLLLVHTSPLFTVLFSVIRSPLSSELPDPGSKPRSGPSCLVRLENALVLFEKKHLEEVL